ncbi:MULTISPECIES: non-canonical purine NTP diphosphatase [Persicobacter]|uniref:dITP/XTP pyrophosphatase n=1 Tax=Persicobacter diffluens TaxID=981 RepID=A0AAN4VXW1_9BACT|nr:non-canonical purine NTP diphosphatase [Persicobacter sp. CCB-QB2]GJM62031.1 non-canonical purine NTP pyrophosphatase [Persicobacter diffluens]
MKEICFATNNPNKIAEIQAMMPEHIKIISLKDIGCEVELPETQDTLEGNSLQKAQYVFDHFQVACFADDTGLEVHALGGEPGVYSARYAGPQRDSHDNMEKLLVELNGKEDRSAQFRTVITLLNEDGQQQFEGIAKGEIIQELSGEQGFGYDPIFKPENHQVTFAEMDKHQKNKISHRGRAVQKLIEYIKEHY